MAKQAKQEWIKITRETMNAADKARHDEVVKAKRALFEAEQAFKQGFTKRIERHVPDGHHVVYSFRFDIPAFAFIESDGGRPQSKGFPFDLDDAEVEAARKALGAPKGRRRGK